MLTLRFWLLLVLAFYLGRKIIHWIIRKWTSQERNSKKFTDGNVSATFKCNRDDRFNITVRVDSACCNRNDVTDDKNCESMDVRAQINRLENKVDELQNKITIMEAEKLKSEKETSDLLQNLRERINKIEKYNTMTEITTQKAAVNNCCGSSADNVSGDPDESEESINGKIDKLKIEIAADQINNAEDTFQRSSATSKPAVPPLTTLPVLSSNFTRTEVMQPPVMSVTPTSPELSNIDKTGVQKAISGECSSNNWSDYILDSYFRYLEGQHRAPPVTLNNDETEISSSTRPELVYDRDNGVQDTQLVLRDIGPEPNPENSIDFFRVTWYAITFNTLRLDIVVKYLWKFVRNSITS